MNIALLNETSHDIPLGLSALFYSAFGVLILHLCQQMAEEIHSASHPDHQALYCSRAAFSIGGLIWVLDVTGFFIYPNLSPKGLQLTPALLGLLINSVSTRLTVPTLSTDTRPGRTCLAALVLAFGLSLGHAVLSSGLAHSTPVASPTASAATLTLLAILSAGFALQHRQARLVSGENRAFPSGWPLKILAGALVTPLHWYLALPLPLFYLPTQALNDNLCLLATVLAFGLTIAVDQLRTRRAAHRRRHIMHRTIAPSTQGHGNDPQLALITDRLPVLLHPKQLQLHFQPIVAPHQPKAHFETLLRVSDPVLGRVNPEKFIQACIRQGQGTQVDMLIIGNALDHLAAWTALGFDMATININVSPATLLEADFVDWIDFQLHQRKLTANQVQLEITEHALIANGSEMVRSIRQLKIRGIGVVMDDFGSGYSSLALLADLPISGFKCDRLFIKGLVQDTRRQALLKRIAELAEDLGIPVTAEGVETKEELEIVLQSGIASVQGYYFARPMPASDVPQWYARCQAQQDGTGSRAP